MEELKLDTEQLKLIDEMAKRNNMSVKELLGALRGGKEETQGILELVKGTGGTLDIQTVLMLKALMGDKRSDPLDKAIAMKMLTQPDPLMTMMTMQQLGGGKAGSDMIDKLIEEQRKTREMIQEIAFGKKVDEAKGEAIAHAESRVSEAQEQLTNALEAINQKVESLRPQLGAAKKGVVEELTDLKDRVEKLREFAAIFQPAAPPEKVVDEKGKINYEAMLDKIKGGIVDVINAAKQAPPQKQDVLQLPGEQPFAEPPVPPETEVVAPAYEGRGVAPPITPEAAALAQRISETQPDAEIKPCCLEELPDGSGAFIIYKDAHGNEVSREFVPSNELEAAKKKFSFEQEIKYNKLGRPYMIEEKDGKRRPRMLSKEEAEKLRES